MQIRSSNFDDVEHPRSNSEYRTRADACHSMFDVRCWTFDVRSSRHNMSEYPTPWQQKTMWAALTVLFVVFLMVIAVAVVWVGAHIISFLQPILIPVAIAAILAYLLDPLVTKMCRRGMKRTPAIGVIFCAAFLALGSLISWVVPTI